MRRALLVAVALVMVAGAGAAALLVAGDGSDDAKVTTPAQATTQACRPPSAATPDAAPDPALSRPATVTVAGARSIDTGGLAPDVVVEPTGGAPWVIVRDARLVQAPVGRLARVDVDAGRLPQVVDVVAGCEVTTVVASDTSTWAGTCDQFGADAGAEVLEMKPDGALGRRVSVPTGCLASVVAATSVVWAASAASVDAPGEIYRIAGDATVAEAVLTLGVDESFLGATADGDSVWLSIQGPSGARLDRIDATNAVVASVTSTGPNRLLGIVDGTLWAQDLAASALVGRDATSGAVTYTIPIEGLVTAAVGTSGVWYQAAAPDATTVTVGRLDANAAPTQVTTYTGGGMDRTGAPLTGVLSVTARGAWLSIQDRLFLISG